MPAVQTCTHTDHRYMYIIYMSITYYNMIFGLQKIFICCMVEAYGAGDDLAMALILQRAVVVTLLGSVPCVILLLFIRRVLGALAAKGGSIFSKNLMLSKQSVVPLGSLVFMAPRFFPNNMMVVANLGRFLHASFANSTSSGAVLMVLDTEPSSNSQLLGSAWCIKPSAWEAHSPPLEDGAALCCGGRALRAVRLAGDTLNWSSALHWHLAGGAKEQPPQAGNDPNIWSVECNT